MARRVWLELEQPHGVGRFISQCLTRRLETILLIYNRGNLIQGMSYADEDQTRNGEVALRLATAEGNYTIPS